MIFITVGSQKFQFNRLLSKVDELVSKGIIKEKVFAQIGVCDYQPLNYEYERYLDKETFSAKISECDIVITHGGTGVIINSVKAGKKVIAVPRLAQYGEHVDDHQLQLLHQFDELGIICSCYNIDDLDDAIVNIGDMTFNTYVSNTDNIIASIEEYIVSITEGC